MLNLKKALLGTTAIVAVGLVFAGASSAQAAVVDQTLNGANAQWGSAGAAGTYDQSDVAHALAGDNVNITSTNTLSIISNNLASDNTGGGGSKVAFTVGAITNTAGVGAVTIDATTGANTTGISSVNITGAFLVKNTDAADSNVIANITNGLTVGSLTLNNTETDAAHTIALNGSTLTTTGAVGITAGGFAGANSTATFTGNVSAGAVTITGGSAAAANAGLVLQGATNTATSFVLDNGAGAATAATLTLSRVGAQSITGTINGQGAGEGTLAIGGSGVKTFASNIGGTLALGSVTIADGTEMNLSTNNVTAKATTFTLTDTGILRVGTGAVTGAIDGDGVGDGGVVIFTANNATGGILGGGAALKEVRVTGGTLSVAHNITATNTNITAGTLAMGASKTITGAITASGTGKIDLGTSTLSMADGSSLATTGTSTIATTISNTTNGMVDIAGAGGVGKLNNTATLLTIAPTVSNTIIKDGDKVILVKDGGAATLGTTSLPTSGLISWSISSAAGAGTDRQAAAYAANDVILTATVRNAASVAGVSASNAGSLNGLMAVANTGATELRDLGAAAQNLTTGAAVDKAGAQLRPEINGVTEGVAFGTTGKVLNLVSNRSDNIRMAQAEGTGLASGESLRGVGLWAQGFGGTADQDRRESVDGYEADTFGGAIGADYQFLKNLRLGASFAYANTNVDDKGTRTGSGLEVDSYVGTIYGTVTGEPWYVDGSLTYGHHEYDSTRLVNFTGASVQTAKGSFDGEQFGAKAEFGWPVAVQKTTVTPFVSLDYNYLDLDGYTETGATSANLAVNGSDTYSLRSGVGAKVAASLGQVKSWTVKPNARAMWAHEFNEDAPDVVARYTTAGGTSFSSKGANLAQDAAILGVGLDVANASNYTVSLKYDAELKDEYVGHSGMLQLRKAF